MKKRLWLTIGTGTAVLGGGLWMVRAEDPVEEDKIAHVECSIFGPQREKFSGGWREARQRFRLGVMTNDVVNRLSAAPAEASSSMPSVPGGSRTGNSRRGGVEYSNLIDKHIFQALKDAGVTPAGKTSDQEFLRRATLDLTGRIPSAQQVVEFITNEDPAKREKLVDSLIGSPEWVDKWTFYFGDLYKNASNQPNAGLNRYPESRDAFNTWIREALASAKSYDQMTRELIGNTGPNNWTQGELTWLVGGLVTNVRLNWDNWDRQAANVAETFLGIAHVDCVLCHNGRGHLDALSVWGKNASRFTMWGLSSFMSHTTMPGTRPNTAVNNTYWAVNDSLLSPNRNQPDYFLNTTSGNRPPRQPIGTTNSISPEYPFASGGKPESGEPYRKSLARLVTSDFQFARAAVNYVWKEFFGRGIVDPVNQFDLARLDPDNPPEEPWELQPSNARLLNALAQDFIDNGYDLRRLMRLIVTSEAYQLSSRYPGAWDLNWEPLFARKLVRRLWGEEIADALATASGIANTFNVGFRNPDGTANTRTINWAMQFPEPLGQPVFLQNFTPGNRDDQERRLEGSILQALGMMNDGFVIGKLGTPNGSLVQRATAANNDDAVNLLYLSILSRFPTGEEKTIATRALTSGNLNRTQRVQNLAWSLYNKVDFLFNY